MEMRKTTKKREKKKTENVGVRAICVTYFECVFIAFVIQYTKRPSQIAICDQSG